MSINRTRFKVRGTRRKRLPLRAMPAVSLGLESSQPDTEACKEEPDDPFWPDMSKPENSILAEAIETVSERGPLALSLFKVRLSLQALLRTSQDDTPGRITPEALRIFLMMLEELDQQCLLCAQCPMKGPSRKP